MLPKNLSNFHKDNEPVEVSLNGTTLKTTQPKTKKTITTIEEWSTAFSSYMAIIIEKFPERAQELIPYFMTIRYAANNTTGLAWVVYDNQFRTQAANNRNLNWGHIDMQLWVKIFCVAPSRLREEYSIFEHGPQPKGTRGAGMCFQFNRAGVICKWQDCPYQHKCNNCFGNHPGFKCPNKGGGGGTQQTTKATQSKLPQPNKLSKFTAKTPIDVDRLELELSDHPDKLFVENLCRDLREGTRIGYTFPRAPRNSKNLPSAYQNPRVVSDTLAQEVALGRVAGPFNSPPLPNLQVSPIGVIPKKHSDKFHLIFHLSHPKTGDSINSFIPKEDFSLQYTKIDNAIAALLTFGPGTYMAKSDIESAFRIFPINKEDWELLGMLWDEKYYVDMFLPFGLRSVPFKFNNLSLAIAWILLYKCLISYVNFILDDFLVMEPLAKHTLMTSLAG